MNYGCVAVCGAPKRRFRPYAPDVSKNANSTDVRKARKEQLKRDEAIGYDPLQKPRISYIFAFLKHLISSLK